MFETELKFIFFGTSKFAVDVLEELYLKGFKPKLIVTTPNKPAGRGLFLVSPPTKLWAESKKVKVVQPNKLNMEFIKELNNINADIFVVASYGKILPKHVLDLPSHGVLNIHPSLLPKYRGPSPVQAQILADDSAVGVTIMLMDEKIDHGPIIAQTNMNVENWPPTYLELEEKLAKVGGALLVQNFKPWVLGSIIPVPQNDSLATYTGKIEKNAGLIDLSANARANFLKIQAYSPWPGTYFFVQTGNKLRRVIIKEAKFKDEKLVITKVTPEGKKEMDYIDFVRGFKPQR